MKKKSILFYLLFNLFLSSVFSQHSLNLMGKWKVTWSGSNAWSSDVETFIRTNPLPDSARYISVDVPLDLNLAMQKRGMFGDINYGTNTLAASWVAQQYWKYYRHFTIAKENSGKTVYVVFDQLDYNATILLNNEVIATHKNAFVPCRVNITGKIKDGENLLVVAIESGLYDVADKEGDAYINWMGSILNKRVWLRKPQYQFGWDSSPTLINVGITGNVRLEWNDVARLDQVVTHIKLNSQLTKAELRICPFIEGLTDKSAISIEASLLETNQKVILNDTLKKSLSQFNLNMSVDQPSLWWPVGYGQQHLYTLKLAVKHNGITIDSAIRRIGFREVEIDQSVHPDTGNYFTVKINHQKIFVKGGNWVPPDLIFSSVTQQRLETIVNMAIDANLNLLRIWGGGQYAGKELLDLCDEKGIMVWHDFPFACAEYPGDNQEFYNSVKKEATWAVREFSCHPSLMLWCGSNENEMFTYWRFTTQGKTVPDYVLYHHLLPVIVKTEYPEVFYWPSSPFSENYQDANLAITGDQHSWGVSLGSDGSNFYAYRNYVDRFPSEGGFLGVSSPATLRQFLPKDEQFVRSVTWNHHDNNFWYDENFTDWFGITYSQISLNDYAFGSALLQSEALSEYITNFHRRKFSSSGAVFWMFKDGWPAAHGWSIVDYYNRKKLAYHPVRRAFEPISIVVAAEGDKINIYGINDKMTIWTGKLQYGVLKTQGGFVINEFKDITLPANASVVLASFDKGIYEKAGYSNHAAFAVLWENGINVAQHKLLLAKYKDVSFEKPKTSIQYVGKYAVLTSPVFVWGVCTDIDGESTVKDNCFDLLPGIPYYIELNKGERISIKNSGNEFMLKILNGNNVAN